MNRENVLIFSNKTLSWFGFFFRLSEVGLVDHGTLWWLMVIGKSKQKFAFMS